MGHGREGLAAAAGDDVADGVHHRGAFEGRAPGPPGAGVLRDGDGAIHEGDVRERDRVRRPRRARERDVRGHRRVDPRAVDSGADGRGRRSPIGKGSADPLPVGMQREVGVGLVRERCRG